MKSPTELLGHVPLYVGLQKAIGADRLRYRCLDEAALQPGETVLDVGCGPAYYFDRLPQPLTYHGFDTDEGYIEWARGKWGDRATFHHGIFDAEAAASLPRFDAVLLLGLLHHLDDEQTVALLEQVTAILQPGGRVVSVDTCFAPHQGRISRWISDHDRGEHVREPHQFLKLAQEAFDDVEGEVVDDVTRVPGAYWFMRMAAGARPA